MISLHRPGQLQVRVYVSTFNNKYSVDLRYEDKYLKTMPSAIKEGNRLPVIENRIVNRLF